MRGSGIGGRQDARTTASVMVMMVLNGRDRIIKSSIILEMVGKTKRFLMTTTVVMMMVLNGMDKIS